MASTVCSRTGSARLESERRAALPWAPSLPERVQAVRGVLLDTPGSLDVEGVATRFKGARRADVAEILQTLVALGQAMAVGDGFEGAERG